MIRLIKSVFILAGVLLVNTITAQVTLNDLVEDQNTDKSKSAKKWIVELNDAANETIAKDVLSVELIKMTKSKHWISLFAEGEVTEELSFQTSKKMYVDKVIDNLKEAGFTLSSTKTTEDTKTFLYTKNNLTVEILALATESTAQTVYLVTLL